MFMVELSNLDDKSEYEQNDGINIAVLDKVDYNTFFWDFMYKNKPCIIKNVTTQWPAMSKWVKNNKPNLDELLNEYGSLTVPVIECGGNCTKKNLPLSQFVDYWNNRTDSDVLYLKDWHLRRNRPDDPFYSVPECFASDWLNEYAVDNDADDFMFVYIGPKGSWTSFHADVYSSYSWSANITGRKRWLLFPPGEELKFADRLGNIPDDVDSLKSDHNYFELIQEAGDMIFVPSGWYHQVRNIEDTISINHNWVNACNIGIMWNALMKSFKSVQEEISEFKDTIGWSEHCQLMLKALFGLNVDEFVDFITYIARKRLKSIEDGTFVKFDRWTFGTNHIKFDLQSIQRLLNTIISDKICTDRHNELESLAREILQSIETH